MISPQFVCLHSCLLEQKTFALLPLAVVYHLALPSGYSNVEFSERLTPFAFVYHLALALDDSDVEFSEWLSPFAFIYYLALLANYLTLQSYLPPAKLPYFLAFLALFDRPGCPQLFKLAFAEAVFS